MFHMRRVWVCGPRRLSAATVVRFCLIALCATVSCGANAADRSDRICDWAVREVLTAANPVRQQRAIFVADHLNCRLEATAALEAHLLRAAPLPASAASPVSRVELPWPLAGLRNLALMLPGVALVAGALVLANLMARRRRSAAARTPR